MKNKINVCWSFEQLFDFNLQNVVQKFNVTTNMPGDESLTKRKLTRGHKQIGVRGALHERA